MHLDKFHINRRFIGNVLLAVFFVMIFAAESRASAIASSQARAQASGQAAANLGAGGPGSDLRAIASLRQPQPQTFTGFPAGTLPGSTIGGVEEGLVDKIVMTMPGDPLLPPLSPVIGSEMIGAKLDRLSVIASHVGYSIVRLGYSPSVIDTPYTFALMSGNRRIATLYFNHSMALVMVQ